MHTEHPRRAQPIHPRKRHRFPNWWVGLLLDHKPPKALPGRPWHPLDSPRAGAYAIHGLAIKLARFDFENGALNESYLRKHHGLGRRATRACLHKLQEAGLLERARAGARWAKEKIVADRGGGYVTFDQDWLRMSSEAFAFAIAVNLSPDPQPPARACRRLGMTSRMKVRDVLKEAAQAGAVAVHAGRRGRILVARVGYAFVPTADVPTTNEPTTNGPSHSSPVGDKGKTEKNTHPAGNEDIIARERANDPFEAVAEAEEHAKLRDELRQADHAHALASHLLSATGIVGLVQLIEKHGERARATVLESLARFAIVGAPPGKVKTWSYFKAALEHEAKAEWMAAKGFRPGDAFGAWRDVPIGETPF